MWIARRLAIAAILALCALSAVAESALAQDSEVLLPDQSAAKAKQIIQQGIEALGGSAYLNVHDVTSYEHVSQFDHSGESTGYMEINDFRQLPNKDRVEYIAHGGNSILQYIVGLDGLSFAHGGIVITLYNGDHGWSYDRSGVNELSSASVIEFQETAREGIGNILRNRIHEPDMIFRYGGQDIVDLKEVDWVEMVDSEDRTIRIAFARATHLPVQKTVETQDPNTRLKTDDVELYSNYHAVDGIETPYQVTRTHNGMKVSQTFFTKCEYNSNLSDALFTKESLEAVDKNHKKDKKSGSGSDF